MGVATENRLHGWVHLSRFPEIATLMRWAHQRNISIEELETVLSRMRYDGQIMKDFACGGATWDVAFYVCLAPQQKICLTLSRQKCGGIHTAIYFEGNVQEKWIDDLVADFIRSAEAHLYNG